MKITTVLFDLDGTLLPMDQELFTKDYFKRLTAKLAPLGYDAQELIAAIWKCTHAMVANDGSRSNEEVFWNSFRKLYGERAERDFPVFDEYYRREFNEVRTSCGFNPLAKQTVEVCRAAGLRTALATNPIFPAVATEARIRWAGLEPEDFELITTYENSGFCKPNPRYYRAVAESLGCQPEECLMVGNDADEDLIAETVGMKVFLVTDCLINRSGASLSDGLSGGFEALIDFIKDMPARV